MIWENGQDLLRCVDLIGEENIPTGDLPVIAALREQISHYDPVAVGWSGQIKEYREEQYYGDIGEYHHRHISHLVGLYPGTVINGNTPEWLKAAQYSLSERGDVSTGWSTGHKMNAWARTKNGNRAHNLLASLLTNRTLPNLWDTHVPFQIDGNFGATAGIAEMLIQSHEGYIHVLPALPDVWKDGAFSGLTARGGIEASAEWRDGRVTHLTLSSAKDTAVKLKVNEKTQTVSLKCGKKTCVRV
jgi:alpha-L-fucosidase 2